jgi:hypothetical protein
VIAPTLRQHSARGFAVSSITVYLLNIPAIMEWIRWIVNRRAESIVKKIHGYPGQKEKISREILETVKISRDRLRKQSSAKKYARPRYFS